MKIGYNQVCINPTFSCLPVGFLTQTEPLNKVRGDLYARCLRMQDDGREVILITFDSLGISQDVQERMEESLRQSIGEDALIIFSCSHTHYAPSLCNALGFIEENTPYLESLDIKLLNLVRNCRMSEDAQLTVSYQVQFHRRRPLPAVPGQRSICSGRSSELFQRRSADWQLLDL